MHKRYSAIALCATAAALAGCGGSGNSGSGTTGLGAHSPSTVVFRADLGTLCQTGNAAIKAAAATSPAKAGTLLGQYLTKLKKLTASLPLQSAYSNFLANLEAEAAALKAGNAAGLKSANEKNAALAKQLGVPACGG